MSSRPTTNAYIKPDLSIRQYKKTIKDEDLRTDYDLLLMPCAHTLSRNEASWFSKYGHRTCPVCRQLVKAFEPLPTPRKLRGFMRHAQVFYSFM
jgi:hypothetical protein